MKVIFPQFSEDEGRVVLEFEVVLGRWSELIADTEESSVPRHKQTTELCGSHIK